jgi:carbamoyltransferase
MNILGINYFFHDTSACIVRDGVLVAALEQERFSRKKHTQEFPDDAIDRCLEIANLPRQDIDCIAVSINPRKHMLRKIGYGISLGRSAIPFFKQEFVRPYLRQRTFLRWYRSSFSVKRKPRVLFVDHHLSHVVGTYLVSPFRKAALLSLDGSGEWSTSWIGEARDCSFTCFSESLFPHSLGSFYESVTEFCGFRPNYDEGKTMGLAPFGDQTVFYEQVEPMVHVRRDGTIRNELSQFRYQYLDGRRCGPKFFETFGQPRSHGQPIEKHHEDAAAAFQKVLEDKVLDMCALLQDRTSADHLVIAGGVALNSVLNGKILRHTRFKDVYIMPAAGDGGTCIGAAYYAHNIVLGNTDRHLHDSPFLGTEYSNEQIEEVLRNCKLNYSRVHDVCRTTASLLRSGSIVAWFQGRMEIGPRALGARSILADPTRPDMKDKINAQVKHRERYRPFAPSVPAERASEFFEIEVAAPFMLKVCKVRSNKRHELPAVTHVDGTARVQTVRRETNERYYTLLQAFSEVSGVPILLNTSFNIMGEPIVESPSDAIRCFFSTGLDALVIGDFIVVKNQSLNVPNGSVPASGDR